VRIGSIGSGRIGGNAGKLFAKAGYEVLFSFSRDRAKWEALADEGALYGQEFHLQEARETVTRLTGR
jgi:predicted dinucleotide-binding enzyme